MQCRRKLSNILGKCNFGETKNWADFLGETSLEETILAKMISHPLCQGHVNVGKDKKLLEELGIINIGCFGNWYQKSIAANPHQSLGKGA